MLLQATFLILMAPGARATPAAGDSCYHYRPASVSLTGRLVQRRMPGPPHYDSFARGDRPETVDFLILEAPICTIPDYNDSPNTDAFQGQDTIQVRRDGSNGGASSALARGHGRRQAGDRSDTAPSSAPCRTGAAPDRGSPRCL